ncbi:hypothetical protein B0H16DRAFT_1523338 [Mycena metata]|uniref:MYND-type domain-containing protein n=1 Tax=Mycena metata TaxID=1033252 RepID=A0AAD7JM79_9AGAR|nr:hypothetical protein B0H16DRAFT_1523338 [Mycena metata]
MHESLRPSSFSKLSSAERTRANSALKGSLPSLRSLVYRAAKYHDEVQFLPVFYHHLDLARIPSLAEMDAQSLPPETLATFSCAYLSVQGIAQLAVPSATQADILQRAWPWIQFLDEYYFWIPEAPTEDILRCWCFALVASLLEPWGETSRRIMATPGIAILVGRAWTSWSRDPNAVTEIAFRCVSRFLFVSFVFPPGDFNEFIEGAGGEEPLAKAALELVEYILENSRSYKITARDVSSIMEFCGLCFTTPWLAALAAHKCLRTTTSVLLFADSVMDGREPTETYLNLFKHTWNVFMPLIVDSDGYIGIVQAVHAGILKFIISHAEKNVEWNEGGTRHLITHVLMARGTLYPSVLALLEKSLPALQQATSIPAFVSSPLHPDWEKFVAVALERIEIKNQVDAGELRTYKACHNMPCGKILRKGRLKRCAGCQYAHYCDADCQLADWRAGHRLVCADTRHNGCHSVELDGPTYCSSYDIFLLRAIVKHDYEQHRSAVFLDRIVKMRQHGLGVVTDFDYSGGPVRIEVQPDPSMEEGGSAWRWAGQAARSAGRMHIVCVKVAEIVETWVLPMRSSDSRVHDALFELSRGIPEGTVVSTLPEYVVKKVAELVEDVCPEIVEIV